MNKGKIKRYHYLLFHLVASVAILGSFFIYLLNLPFCLLSPWSHKARRVSAVITQWGLYSLRVFQPWWKGSLTVNLPASVVQGDSGCLCVANHRSHMDVFLLLEQIRGLRVLTKHLIFLVPGLGIAAYMLRMIKVKRGDQESFWKAMSKIEQAFNDNEIVHVFPEMTRASYGDTELKRFTLAPFQKALSAGVPVVPIVIWGTDYLWPKGTYAIASKGPLVVKSLPAIESQKFESAAELSDHV
ncbi:MAG: lysophospholipid acyltransferase family protein, partial [Pseudomonadota bacterium]